jgi:hypothetical protein
MEYNMEDLSNMPAPVREVHEALLANARQNWDDDFAEDAVYTRPEERRNHETNKYEPTGNWIVGPNFEGWGSSMIFADGDWYYRSSHTGEDKQMAHGHEEALGNANCFFTG